MPYYMLMQLMYAITHGDDARVTIFNELKPALLRSIKMPFVKREIKTLFLLTQLVKCQSKSCGYEYLHYFHCMNI